MLFTLDRSFDADNRIRLINLRDEPSATRDGDSERERERENSTSETRLAAPLNTNKFAGDLETSKLIIYLLIDDILSVDNEDYRGNFAFELRIENAGF